MVTKSFFGESSVYAVPAIADPTRVQTLRRVAEIRFSMTGTPGGPSAIGQLTATGAAMSADGRLLAVRTYTDAYLWPVSSGDIAAALRGSPVRIALPEQRLGEGIAVQRLHAAGGLRRRRLDGVRGADACVPTGSGSPARDRGRERTEHRPNRLDRHVSPPVDNRGAVPVALVGPGCPRAGRCWTLRDLASPAAALTHAWAEPPADGVIRSTRSSAGIG